MAANHYNVLIIDDEASMRHMLRLVLEKNGYRVEEAENGAVGLERMGQVVFDAVLCDIRMPEIDGMEFLRQVQARSWPADHLPPTIIMMSAYGSIDTALACMQVGAYDYISKPLKPEEVILTLKKAEERQRLQRENRRLKEDLGRQGKPCGIDGIIHKSSAMQQVLGLVKTVADSMTPVLIGGETGTGKELIARALHSESSRKEKNFVAVNCSAINAGVMESELFGHVKGAFTGADRDRPGLFSAADGGTLFLDEIGELPLELQPKLLRVLQEGEVLRVGESRTRKVNVRVVAATSRELQDEVAKGRFRDDLYFRLAVVEIHLPPLRERSVDIPLLAEFFLQRIARREGRKVPILADEARDLLKGYAWPGNVRELENFMEKTMIFCRGDQVDITCLPWEARRKERDRSEDFSLKQAMERLEREYIRKALAATDGNRSQAARLLEISLRALMYKIKDYDLG